MDLVQPTTCCRTLLLLGSLLLVLDGHFICWQAVLRCQQEKECELAYNQYLAACDAYLKGNRKQCPSHCISALVRLNQTQNGPDLESCDCGQDQQCRRVKRTIEPCIPRRLPPDADSMGCTEARQHCEEEPGCHSTLTAYLSNCGQLFNGRKCTLKCKSTIQQMLLIPSGGLLNRCVCDGVERPFCEVVKENMSKLCAIGEQSLSTVDPESEDMYEDEEEEPRTDREEGETDTVTSYSGSGRTQLSLFVYVVCILVSALSAIAH
ncbi:growth arrest-specific protein 1 [Polypterus senegalus]